MAQVGPQVMLTEGIARAYRDGKARFEARNAVKPLLDHRKRRPNGEPEPLRDHGRGLAAGPGAWRGGVRPLGLVVRVRGMEEMLHLARGFEGQLTATIHMEDADLAAARELLPVLERKAGRVLVNGFPTGVEVCDAMVHGGPYPASTNFGATSVGTMAIRRFLRPVCYQGFPEALLPQDLR